MQTIYCVKPVTQHVTIPTLTIYPI